METPYLTHITDDDYKYVYEPAEDSFLLLDAIEADLPALIESRPLVCVELGCGSGVIITATAKVLSETACFAIDINPRACTVTKKTAEKNDAPLDIINMNLLMGFQPHSIDLLIFNPPYVVTTDEEVVGNTQSTSAFNANIVKSWAGGTDGRIIMDRVFNELDSVLTSTGVAYILVIEENKPNEILKRLRATKLCGSIVIERRIRGEHLFVLKIQRE